MIGTTSLDIATMCGGVDADVDASDDTAVLALADALEEAGCDSRALGLRKIPATIAPCRWKIGSQTLWGWLRCNNNDIFVWHCSKVPTNLFNKLLGGRRTFKRRNRITGQDRHVVRIYRTRSLAYLALAEVLVLS